MAVYTHVDEKAAESFLKEYEIGDLISLTGVEQGVENTNYIIDTTKGRYVLTLFEKRVAANDLPFFMAAMAHMSANAIPAPAPVVNKKDAVVGRLRGRPAAITTFLSGQQHMEPAPDECRMMGETSARLHLVSRNFSMTRKNTLSLEGWRALAAKTVARADECASGLSNIIQGEIDFQTRMRPTKLETGLVHADLFPDNVFFEGGHISGVIDFYFACTDAFAYDLAITLNAWAHSRAGWSEESARALIAGYQNVRRITEAEKSALPVFLRGAALRILLTRLYDFLNRVDGAVVAIKDPLEYRDLLLIHRDGGSRDLFG